LPVGREASYLMKKGKLVYIAGLGGVAGNGKRGGKGLLTLSVERKSNSETSER